MHLYDVYNITKNATVRDFSQGLKQNFALHIQGKTTGLL